MKLRLSALAVASEGVKPWMHEVNHSPLVYKNGFVRWEKELLNNKPISGIVKEFPPDEQKILHQFKVLSLLLYPLIVQITWHGFVGIDSSQEERLWNKN